MHPKGRILALDYGEKNVGLACSDALGLTVTPLTSIPNLGRKDLFKRLRTAIHALDIQELVLGIPLNMDGTAGDSVRRMRKLAEALRANLRIPVTGVDERLSTAEAIEVWQNMSARQQKKYRTSDSLAAAFILERYLKGI